MSSARPLIGLTTSEKRNPVRDELLPHAEAGREEIVLNWYYMRAVTAAGGLPVVMSPQPLDAVQDLVARLDGVLIPGGPDIDPSFYGHEPDDDLGETWPEVDEFEIAVVRAAEARGLPVLGICRGMQLINVAHGGTLYQHLPDHVGGQVVHRRLELTDPVPMHPVRIEAGSRLAGWLGGRERAEVNSYHHQAPWEVGDGLRAVAWADDGVIEGIEGGNTLGVQWHAEAMDDMGLFEALTR